MSLRGAAKAVVFNACRYLGMNRTARSRRRRELLVLAYHGVVTGRRTDRLLYANTVSVGEFDRHMAMLRRHFHPVSTAEVLAWHEGQDSLPDNPVLVTFDDGYRNNLTLAAPVLRSHGVPCIFHVASGYIGTARTLWPTEVVYSVLRWPHEDLPIPVGGTMAAPKGAAARRQLALRIKEGCKRIPWGELEAYLGRLRESSAGLDEDEELCRFMTWDEVRELKRQGFEIGAHSVEHPILSQVPPDRVRFELRESKHRIEEETGAPCAVVAYPNGDVKSLSAEVLRVAQEEGYRLGFTTVERFTKRPGNPVAVNRVCIMGHLPVNDFHFRVSGWKLPSDNSAGPFDSAAGC